MKRITVQLLTLICGLPIAVQSQTLTQTVRGTVVDEAIQTPLVGATVRIVIGEQTLGGYSDELGHFSIENVPVGRVTLEVTYIGYQPILINNLIVTSGKQAVLNLSMVEDISSATEEVVVTWAQKPGETINEFSTISSRPFSTEEANRFAGSLGDPARMATNFAGVVSAGDTRNDIVVRGNSPLGLLWRMEGVDIPNPNHFSTQGANGGPVSILNNNTLANSDFITGAFAPEYGNATSGVFDLKLRKGNTAKRESSFQIGFGGFEVFTEGPIKKGSNSSYLIAGRYSTLSVFDALGIQFGDLLGVPNFYDLTTKFEFDLKSAGKLSFFTVAGRSEIDILESELDDTDWNDTDISKSLIYQDIRQQVFTGTAGLSHNILLGTRTLLKNTLAYSYEWRDLDVDTVYADQATNPLYNERYRVGSLQWASNATLKFSARNNLRFGLFAKQYNYDVKDSITLFNMGTPYETVAIRNLDEGTFLGQVYAQHQLRLDQLTLTGGLHFLYFDLNKQSVFEPRLGLQYDLRPQLTLTAGYGMHHQTQVPVTYFSIDTLTGTQPNKAMRMTRSQHLVAGVESNLTPLGLRIKLEGYYQWLDHIPADPISSTYSAVNLGANFERPPDRTGFVNTGTATTQGVELTLERSFTNHYYALLTASVFKSEYTPSDGRTYNTAYNNGYVLNLLTGVEYTVGKQQNTQVFADLRIATSGGFRYTPVDLAASQAAGQEINVPNSAFSEQGPAYFRADLKIGIRQNFKKWSQEFNINLQNFTNQQNVFTRQYNPRLGNITDRYQLGFFPVPQYKIYF